MNSKKIRILLTGSGAPGWVPIYKCLLKGSTKLEIFGSDVKPQTAGAFYAKKHFTLPHGSDKTYVKKILSICRREKIQIILPITDPELLPLADNKNLFAKYGITILVSDGDSIERVQNKFLFYSFLRENNLCNPNYRIAENLKQFKKAVSELGFPKNPICFKPTVTSGSRGFRIVDPNINAEHIFLEEKPSSTYTTLEQSLNMLSKIKPFPSLLVMEYLPGNEYSVDVFIHEDKIEYIIPRLRQRTKEGISIESITEKNNEVIKKTKDILHKFQFNYAVGLQFRYDNNGIAKILEINPRLQGTTVAALGAGVNIPYFSILAAIKKQIPNVHIDYGVHMYRNWQEVFFKQNKKISNT